jgi:hypothetical protein
MTIAIYMLHSFAEWGESGVISAKTKLMDDSACARSLWLSQGGVSAQHSISVVVRLRMILTVCAGLACARATCTPIPTGTLAPFHAGISMGIGGRAVSSSQAKFSPLRRRSRLKAGKVSACLIAIGARPGAVDSRRKVRRLKTGAVWVRPTPYCHRGASRRTSGSVFLAHGRVDRGRPIRRRVPCDADPIEI